MADGELDFVANRFWIAKQRFAAVIASRRPLQPATTADLSASGQPCPPTDGRTLPPITEANVRSLTDDEVLLLLEEHARRVVESPEAKLVAAAKISLMPIIRRKMQHRHSIGEMQDKQVAEFRILAEWIATKVPSHQVPTAHSIQNALRNDYKALMA